MSKLEAGEQAYLNAIQVNPSLASLSFDLGVNYYYQAMSSTNDFKKSMDAIKKAIQIGSDSPIGKKYR